jgi:hypothetical protein
LSIQDSLPERRNLTLISIAFIAFFYGGGHFTSNEVRLVIINAEFSKPYILVLIAWASLFWCLWRYWLVTKEESFRAFKDDIQAIATNDFSFDYVTQRVPYKLKQSLTGDSSVGYYWGGGVEFSAFMLSATIKYDSYTPNNNHPTDKERAFKVHLMANRQPDVIVKFNDLHGVLYIIYVLLKASVVKPSFTGFILPYILFLLALLGGLV